MNFQVRNEVCSTCPWRQENKHQLIGEQVKNIIENDIISPCHQELNKVTGSCTTGVEKYAFTMKKTGKPFKICKGATIARARANIEYKNPMIGAMYLEVEDDLNDPNIVDMDYIYKKQ